MTALAKKQTGPIHAELEFRGNRLGIDPAGCLLWPEQSLLIISDLHLEKGSSFASHRGAFLPPYDTAATLEALTICMGRWNPKTVISLGDSFHDKAASSRLPESYRLQLKQVMHGKEWIWISGNHDPHPPEDMGGICCTELQIGNLNFRHEPTPNFSEGEIAGHLHPSARILSRGKSLRRRCVVGDERRLILPAFGAFTGGLNVRDDAFDGLFYKDQLKVWMLGRENVYCICGSQLCSG